MQTHASTTPARPLRPFAIALNTRTRRVAYTALARSSGEALQDAINSSPLTFPFGASVKPVGTPADATRLVARKLALADLVEG